MEVLGRKEGRSQGYFPFSVLYSVSAAVKSPPQLQFPLIDCGHTFCQVLASGLYFYYLLLVYF